MLKKYEKCFLLLELAVDQPFYLQLTEWKSQEISFNDLSSKIVILLLHYPALRILWSMDLLCTIGFFQDLLAGVDNSADSNIIGELMKKGDASSSSQDSGCLKEAERESEDALIQVEVGFGIAATIISYHILRWNCFR